MRKLSVCLSDCPSVKRVDRDKTEERSVQILANVNVHVRYMSSSVRLSVCLSDVCRL